ncbi:hypothetical protein QQX98_004323 [Neonectria punicea]|uniref:Uncharacterized protein n=1 Tax=Neonectria punicea TaxID=979145 RepID=A0ABR1H9Q1_9HYPO
MSLNLVPTYYSSPNFSIAPPDANGPLHLGSVIADLKDPVPLNPSIIVPIPADEIFKSHLTGFSTTLAKSRRLKLGILARLLGLNGPAAEPSVSQGRSQDEELSVRLLETQYFNPSPKYMDNSINLPSVKAFRKASRDRLPVFLVTGIKIARGASASIVRGKSVDSSVQASIVGGASGLVEIEPSVRGQWTTQREMSFRGSSDFILAYRVTKLMWKKGEVKGKAYTSGATMVDDNYVSASTGNVIWVHDFTDEAAASQIAYESGSAFLEASKWVFTN